MVPSSKLEKNSVHQIFSKAYVGLNIVLMEKKGSLPVSSGYVICLN